MSTTKFKVGSIGIRLPDENQGYFTIFEDLAEFFRTDYQSDAVKILRAKLKDIKPKASIDYESDYTHITTSNVETLLSVINIIFELTNDEYKNGVVLDLPKLKIIFDKAKKTRPKPKIWNTGDIFLIPLIDNTFAYGQILNKKYCTCVLFDIKANENTLSKSRFEQLNPLSILHLSNGDLLNNGQWKILFNEPVSLDPNSGSGGKIGTIGCISFGGCGMMVDLANAYWGLQPWNVLYEENYYDLLLFKGVLRPETAIILNQIERAKFRKEKFGID
jgi:hypothetical protein